MRGFVVELAQHALRRARHGVDARDKRGHDGGGVE
jgi:hypothetical protein